jgi:zeta-carotene desaturase
MTGHPPGAPDVVVVGGGFAGIAAATALAAGGARVVLLEARPYLGGRARSWVDPITGTIVDNGQHLFMGCYDETFRLLERLGTRDRLALQPRLEIPMVDPGGRTGVFRLPQAPAPWDGILGLLRYPGLGLGDRLGLLRVARAARRARSGDTDLHRMTVDAWLDTLRQAAEPRRRLWHPLSLAVLNEEPDRAAADGLAEVVSRAFLGGPGRSSLGLPRTGLSDLHAEPALHWLRSRGAEVRTRSPVLRLLMSGERCAGVVLAGGERLPAGAVVAAVPPGDLLEILPPALAEEPFFARVRGLRASAIVSVHLWFGAPVLDLPFAGLVGGTWHWIFGRAPLAGTGGGAHAVTLVRSAAGAFAERPRESLVRAALDDLRAYFPSSARSVPRHSLVIKEKQATVSLIPGHRDLRPGPRSPVGGLLLAGDWTATGLPATIEGAVASGHACAGLLATAR